MSIFSELASVLGVNNDNPNQELAKKICAKNDKSAIIELVNNLKNKNKSIQSDCIKTLYETAYIKPELIADYIDEFIALLTSKNNRLIWGAMKSLESISSIRIEKVLLHLPVIIESAEKGSVITRDAAFGILINLCKLSTQTDNILPLVKKQLLIAPVNQLPMYAEKCFDIINAENKNEFIRILQTRLPELLKESQQKRMDKIIDKLSAY